MFVDFVHNGAGHGAVGQRLQEIHYDPGYQRPYVDSKSRTCVSLKTGRVVKNQAGIYVHEVKPVFIRNLRARGIDNPTWNSASLRWFDWVRLDSAVNRAARLRMRAYADLRAANTYEGFDAMAKMTIEFEGMTDNAEAMMDMDGLSDGRTDSPLYDIHSLPLPITHSDFNFSQRRIAVSRNDTTPIDTTMAENAGHRVGELIEKVTIGTEAGITYGTRTTGPYPHVGTSTVWGYTTFPYRITMTTLHTPTGANPEAVMEDVLGMVELATQNSFYGPFTLYTSTGYSRFLNDDYFRSGSTSAVRSLRQRIMEIEGITDIRRLDYLSTGYQMLLVQMDPMVVQAVNGMEVKTLQWETTGGLRKNFKVMAIQVPMFRAKTNGLTGIIHATTS